MTIDVVKDLAFRLGFNSEDYLLLREKNKFFTRAEFNTYKVLNRVLIHYLIFNNDGCSDNYKSCKDNPCLCHLDNMDKCHDDIILELDKRLGYYWWIIM